MTEMAIQETGTDLSPRRMLWRVVMIVAKLLPALWLLQSEQSFVYQGF